MLRQRMAGIDAGGLEVKSYAFTGKGAVKGLVGDSIMAGFVFAARAVLGKLGGKRVLGLPL